jgi:hypothetical protein
MLRIINIVIFFILISNLIHANDDCDSCNCQADRILSTFEKFKSKYVSVLKDSIKISLKRDSIYEKNNLKEGDIDLDKFTYYINPILRLNKNAVTCNDSDNFCKFFDIDTVTFGCEAGVFYNDSLYFYCILGDPDCNNIPFHLIMMHYHYYINEHNLKVRNMWYQPHKRRFGPDVQLKFILKGYPDIFFIINNNIIKIRDYSYPEQNKRDFRIEEDLREMYQDKWTRKVARDCHSE